MQVFLTFKCLAPPKVINLITFAFLLLDIYLAPPIFQVASY